MKAFRCIWTPTFTITAALVALPFLLAAGHTERPDAKLSDRRSVTESVLKEAMADSIIIDAYAARYRISVNLANLIYQQAMAQKVDPAIVFGLIKTESSFNPRAIGSQGALGLMQIKPSTARIYDRRVTREQLFRPDVNIRLGLRHLLEEVEYFGDDWKLGLLAYNMGRTRVSRTLERGGIPRNRYAAKILAHCEELCS